LSQADRLFNLVHQKLGLKGIHDLRYAPIAFSSKNRNKNAAATDKIAKNQFISLKSKNSFHSNNFDLNVTFLDFLNAFYQRQKTPHIHLQASHILKNN